MRIRANNPGPMTLSGTNTYVLTSQDDDAAVVIDPGPESAEHREAFLAEVGHRSLRAIVLTHQHADHSEMLGSVDRWAPEVPVYAALDRFARHADPEAHGDRSTYNVDHADILREASTPGHPSDSISLFHPGALYSGDTILGEGTKI